MKSIKEIFKDKPKYIERYVDLVYEIADRLQSVRGDLGITQKEMAKILEMKESQLSRILAGEDNLTLKTIAKIETALDQDILQVEEEKNDFRLVFVNLNEIINSTRSIRTWEKQPESYVGSANEHLISCIKNKGTVWDKSVDYVNSPEFRQVAAKS